jgi:hypothetical protein
MTTWPPTTSRLRFYDFRISRQAFADVRARWRTAARNVGDILSICSRGLIAAHHYQRLKSKSDADLAADGLQRGDVPRSAFEKLTEKS